jgi:hypothetical protein
VKENGTLLACSPGNYIYNGYNDNDLMLNIERIWINWDSHTFVDEKYANTAFENYFVDFYKLKYT